MYTQSSDNLVSFSKILNHLRGGIVTPVNGQGGPKNFMMSGALPTPITSKPPINGGMITTLMPCGVPNVDFRDPAARLDFFQGDLQRTITELSSQYGASTLFRTLPKPAFQPVSKTEGEETANIKQEIIENWENTREISVKGTGKGVTREESIAIDEAPKIGGQSKPIVIDGSPQSGKQGQKKAKIASTAPTSEEMKTKIDQDYLLDMSTPNLVIRGGAHNRSQVLAVTNISDSKDMA
jgi:hypothetical protein